MKSTTPAQPKQTRPDIFSVQKISEQAAKRANGNPLIGLAVNALERFAAGMPADTESDHILRKALAAMPDKGQTLAQTALKSWRAVSPELRAKVVSRELAKLPPTATIDKNTLDDLLRPFFTTVSKDPVAQHRQTPPATTGAQITLIDGHCYPGGLANLHGVNFQNAGLIVWQPDQPGIPAPKPTPVGFLSSTRAQLTIPKDIVPGQYQIALENEIGLFTRWYPMTINYPEYRVEFTKIRCVKRTPGMGEDEIVTNWFLLWDNHTGFKSTGEYKGFNDGTEEPYRPADRQVFPLDGKSKEVRKHLGMIVLLYEWDEGKPLEKEVYAVADFAKAVINLAVPGGFLLWGLLEIHAEFLAWLSGVFGTGPDLLGIKPLVWQTAELQQKTMETDSFRDSLDVSYFGDDGGHFFYLLEYKVTRAEPIAVTPWHP